jgi:hypothetical protein
MVRRTRNARTVLLLAALAMATGCSSRPAVGEVEGVVKIGGKPQPRLRIQFMPDPLKGTSGPISTGTTDENGRFKLTCADGRAGAIVGTHRIVITDMSVRLPRESAHGSGSDGKESLPKQPPQQSRVPDQYTTSAKTPLSVEVKPEKQELEIDLTRGTVNRL